jgi:four helix bundle protein
MLARTKSYKELIVWQKSMQLCEEVYRATEEFPKSEIYGLTAQVRRCVVSIPSNIAEGYYRGHDAEYKQFLRIAYASGAELETQLLIALRVGYIQEKEVHAILSTQSEVSKMLNKLIQVLHKKS